MWRSFVSRLIVSQRVTQKKEVENDEAKISFLFFFNSSIISIDLFNLRINAACAKVINDQLQEVSKVIMRSMTNEREFAVDEVNAFIKKLADLSDKYKISIDSIFPKVVSSEKSYLVEQGYTLSVVSTFVQMGKFLSELESFDHIIKINTIDVRPVKEEKSDIFDEVIETRYKVTFELSIFMIIKEA